MVNQTITRAERIRELGTINADVSVMLESAGRAINALTNRPISAVATTGDDDTKMVDDVGDSLETHQEAFKSNTEGFYTGLQSIIARLRRQAIALEEAGIITAESPSLPMATARPTAVQSSHGSGRTAGAPTQNLSSDAITNAGLGKFDVGWLNSRGNKVGAEKEAELVQEIKELLERELSRNSNI